MWRKVRRSLKSRRVAPEGEGESSPNNGSESGFTEGGVELKSKQGCTAFLRRRKTPILPTIVEERPSQTLCPPDPPLEDKPSKIPILQSILRFRLKLSLANTDLRRLTKDRLTNSPVDSDGSDGQPGTADGEIPADLAEAVVPPEADAAVAVIRVDVVPGPQDNLTTDSPTALDADVDPQAELEPDTPDDRVPSARTRVAWAKVNQVFTIPSRGEQELPSSSPDKKED